MKITNKLNLPKQLVELVDNNYKPTHKQYSCTTILKPTRQIILERRYSNEIEQDVSDMCWMIFGIAVHSVIENSKESEGQFKEEKLKVYNKVKALKLERAEYEKELTKEDCSESRKVMLNKLITAINTYINSYAKYGSLDW